MSGTFLRGRFLRAWYQLKFFAIFVEEHVPVIKFPEDRPSRIEIAFEKVFIKGRDLEVILITFFPIFDMAETVFSATFYITL